MASKLHTYQLLGTGLTQQDQAFRDALEELSNTPMNFYDNRRSAYNRLNHAMVNGGIDLMHPVQIAGLVDYPSNQLIINVTGEDREYALDEIDPRYLATINQANPAKKEKVPLTEMALELLDTIHDDVIDKPQVPDSGIAGSKNVLQQAFINEMVFQVELEDFIDKNGLDGIIDEHDKEFSEMIDKSSFAASFNDGLEDLSKQVKEMAQGSKLEL